MRTFDLRPPFDVWSPRSCALLLLLFSCGLSEAAEKPFRISSGLDYSSGKYQDDAETTILYIPYFASYRHDRFIWKAGVSWVSIDGPGSVVDGGVVLPGSESRRESGPGDTWVSLSYEIEAFPEKMGFLDITGKLKIPTADEKKGLGTGKSDQVLQLDYMYPLDRLIPSVTISYKRRGDPQAYKLNNTVALSLGADWRQTEKLHLGMSLDYQQASQSGLDDPLDLFGYLSYKNNRRWTTIPYLYFGLSDGSPDFGTGLQLVFTP